MITHFFRIVSCSFTSDFQSCVMQSQESDQLSDKTSRDEPRLLCQCSPLLRLRRCRLGIRSQQRTATLHPQEVADCRDPRRPCYASHAALRMAARRVERWKKGDG